MTIDDVLSAAFRGRGIHSIAHDAIREAMEAEGRKVLFSDRLGPSRPDIMARLVRDKYRDEVWRMRDAGMSMMSIGARINRSDSYVAKIVREGRAMLNAQSRSMEAAE